MDWNVRQIHVRMEELVKKENYLTCASAGSSRLETTAKVHSSHLTEAIKIFFGRSWVVIFPGALILSRGTLLLW